MDRVTKIRIMAFISAIAFLLLVGFLGTKGLLGIAMSFVYVCASLISTFLSDTEDSKQQERDFHDALSKGRLFSLKQRPRNLPSSLRILPL